MDTPRSGTQKQALALPPSCPHRRRRPSARRDRIARQREPRTGHPDHQPALIHGAVTVYAADCLRSMTLIPDASIDAVITDPPYGLADHRPAAIVAALSAWVHGERESVPDGRGFMRRAWDGFVPPPAVWDQCLRVLKPGGHLLCFAGARTVDLMGLSIRLAGFEIRDSITWLYGSGFPKSFDVSKAMDKAAAAEREVLGLSPHSRNRAASSDQADDAAHGYIGRAEGERRLTAAATDAARQWSGWGTALKPASEPIIVARKPLEGTVAANVLTHATGALNIDACRVASADTVVPPALVRDDNKVNDTGLDAGIQAKPSGRWPANVVLDEHAAAALDTHSGILTSGANPTQRGSHKFQATYGHFPGHIECQPARGADSGGASRFFPVFRYHAKAPATERPTVEGTSHPTVKPLELIRWLVRLVTPPGGLVLDPFAGSGTTGQAAELEGLRAVLIEAHPAHIKLIHKRLTGEDPTPAEGIPAS